MAYLPRMIYKGGKLSPRKTDQYVAKDFSDLMAKVQEDYLPLGCESIENLGEIPELKLLMAQNNDARKVEEKTAAIVAKVRAEVLKDNEIPEEKKPRPAKRRKI